MARIDLQRYPPRKGAKRRLLPILRRSYGVICTVSQKSAAGSNHLTEKDSQRV